MVAQTQTDGTAPADETDKPLVVIADPVAEEGLARLRPHARVRVVAGQGREALLQALPNADGLVVRSETKVTRDLLEVATRLRVIGRAGAGVDTIDVTAATERGIVVVNAPGGNAVAACEQALALMFALARNVAAADASMKRGEWSRSKLTGIELTGKTLGLVGLGRVGSEVAQRAKGLQMRVLVYDPYVPAERIAREGLEAASLDYLLSEAHFVSLHVPLTDGTRNLLNAERLKTMRPGGFLVNCARGGLVDMAALVELLDNGHIAGAGIDVWAQEPVSPDDALSKHPRVVATPHLGASTAEAQVNVGEQIADEVLAILNGLPAQFAVNAPTVRAEEARTIKPFMGLARLLGKIATQMAKGHLESAEVIYRGDIAEQNVAPVTAAALQGLLEPISDSPVNLVNARLLAQQRGLPVSEAKSTSAEGYTSLVRVNVRTGEGTTSVAGVISDDQPHVVEINGFGLHLLVTPGYLLATEHTDRPGVIGVVGMLLGNADVNISSMDVGRAAPRGPALMLLSVDEPVPDAVLDQIRSTANISSVRVIAL